MNVVSAVSGQESKKEYVNTWNIILTQFIVDGIIAAVQFGENIDANDEIRSRVSSRPMGATFANSQKIPVVTLQLFFPIKGVIPYKIGSKWKITINDQNGEISIKET